MDKENQNGSMNALLEGLIFTAGEEGLSIIQIQSVLVDQLREEISARLYDLQKSYLDPDHGIELVCYGGRWKFVAKEMISASARRLYAKTSGSQLSGAAFEVLSLVAYRQPITRVEIDEIRGVSSELMLKKLQARGLIETCGHKDTVGKPLLYQVASGFYDAFGLESLEDLPQIVEQESITLFSTDQESTELNFKEDE